MTMVRADLGVTTRPPENPPDQVVIRRVVVNGHSPDRHWQSASLDRRVGMRQLRPARGRNGCGLKRIDYLRSLASRPGPAVENNLLTLGVDSYQKVGPQKAILVLREKLRQNFPHNPATRQPFRRNCAENTLRKPWACLARGHGRLHRQFASSPPEFSI